jgi:hypothetical protein
MSSSRGSTSTASQHLSSGPGTGSADQPQYLNPTQSADHIVGEKRRRLSHEASSTRHNSFAQDASGVAGNGDDQEEEEDVKKPGKKASSGSANGLTSTSCSAHRYMKGAEFEVARHVGRASEYTLPS